jgi:uncharacterized protein (TIGR03435 family)
MIPEVVRSAGISFLLGIAVFSQSTSGLPTSPGAEAPVQFDAAIIKLDQLGPGEAGMRGGPGTNSPGRVRWRREWLRELVATAFHVDPWNVSGPDWIAFSHAQLYALTATMPPDTSRHDFELMLQAFLIEQFKLKLRHEPKPFPAYELLLAPGGPRLKPSADPDAPDTPLSPPKIGDDGFPVMPPGHGQRVALIRGFHGKFQSYTMSEFAEHLSGFVTLRGERRHYVSDKTGLTGAYDFTLKFDDGGAVIVTGPAAQAAMSAPDASEPGSGLPNVYKALEQQLGLKLVKTKDILLDTIVIEHAEKIPAGN